MITVRMSADAYKFGAEHVDALQARLPEAIATWVTKLGGPCSSSQVRVWPVETHVLRTHGGGYKIEIVVNVNDALVPDHQKGSPAAQLRHILFDDLQQHRVSTEPGDIGITVHVLSTTHHLI